MEILYDEGVKTLIPTQKAYLLAIEDTDKPEDEKYYFQAAYLPAFVTLEDCQKAYIEVNKDEN